MDSKKYVNTNTDFHKIENFKSICALIPNKHEFYASSAYSENKTLDKFEQKFRNGEIENINASDAFGWTFLHYAVSRNNIEAINFIVKNGGDIELKNEDGETPLFTATVLENLDAMKALIKLGAKIDTRNSLGIHLLYIAEHKKNSEIGNILRLEQKKKTIDIYSNPTIEKIFKQYIDREVQKNI